VISDHEYDYECELSPGRGVHIVVKAPHTIYPWWFAEVVEKALEEFKKEQS
jgi:hypothetical protein